MKCSPYVLLPISDIATFGEAVQYLNKRARHSQSLLTESKEKRFIPILHKILCHFKI